MREEAQLRLERTPYPSGQFSAAGENLRALTRDESRYVPPYRPKRRPSHVRPIVVPTIRDVGANRADIVRILRLSAADPATLVVFLCSGRACKDDIARLAGSVKNANWVAVDGPFRPDGETPAFEATYHRIAGGVAIDTAQKRNLGLHLARRLRWRSVFFLDDDVRVEAAHVGKALDLLDGEHVSAVGFSARSFPDNSVVAHAHRLATGSLDAFVGSGALAVRTDTRVGALFPHIYNEDWLFLLVHCLLSDGDVVWAGTIGQRRYRPFANVRRALTEEVGDVLGEGLMRLVMSVGDDIRRDGSLAAVTEAISTLADRRFWEQEINTRLAFIAETQERIRRTAPRPRNRRALRALAVAQRRLVGGRGHRGLDANELAHWVQAWLRDLNQWNNAWTAEQVAADLPTALDAAGLAGRYVYGCPTPLLAPDEDQAANGRAELRPDLSVPPQRGAYLDMTGAAYRPIMTQGVDNTRIVQQFLTEQRLSLPHLVQSARGLRFDRPLAALNESMPQASVAMVVASGESVARVASSVASIVAVAGPAAPVQLVVWVQGGRDVAGPALAAYRDRLVAQLVCDLAGTNVRLRSSVTQDAAGTVDELIDHRMRDLALAYWKANVPADHQVIVVNSRAELLRYGTFWQFMRSEHILPDEPFATVLRKAVSGAESAAEAGPITSQDDDDALARARVRLVQPPARGLVAVLGRHVRAARHAAPTTTLLAHLRRTRLSWVELDELAYGVQFADVQDERTLASSTGVMCVPVPYVPGLPSDTYALACQVADQVAGAAAQRLGAIVVIQATSPHPGRTSRRSGRNSSGSSWPSAFAWASR